MVQKDILDFGLLRILLPHCSLPNQFHKRQFLLFLLLLIFNVWERERGAVWQISLDNIYSLSVCLSQSGSLLYIHLHRSDKYQILSFFLYEYFTAVTRWDNVHFPFFLLYVCNLRLMLDWQCSGETSQPAWILRSTREGEGVMSKNILVLPEESWALNKTESLGYIPVSGSWVGRNLFFFFFSRSALRAHVCPA